MNPRTLVILGLLLMGLAAVPQASACHRDTDLCMLYEENVAPHTGSNVDDIFYGTADYAEHAMDDLNLP